MEIFLGPRFRGDDPVGDVEENLSCKRGGMGTAYSILPGFPILP